MRSHAHRPLITARSYLIDRELGRCSRNDSVPVGKIKRLNESASCSFRAPEELHVAHGRVVVLELNVVVQSTANTIELQQGKTLQVLG